MKKLMKYGYGVGAFLAVMVLSASAANAVGVVPTSMPPAKNGEVLGAQTQSGLVPTSMPVANGSAVLGASNYQFSRNLSLYAKGEDVRKLQIWLNSHGYAVASNGAGSAGKETTVYGRATAEAVKKFQSAQGLKADGSFGSMTRAAVNGF